MDERSEHTVATARDAAARDDLAEWVAEFLCCPGSDNPVLAEMLTDPPRAWLGPIELPLDQLSRLAGPPDAPVLCPVDEDDWRDDVEDLATKIRAGAEPPPVIVSYRDEELVVEDGNHRIEALRRAGVEQAWSVVGFETADDRDRFIERSAAVER
jgi:hypothetical protein